MPSEIVCNEAFYMSGLDLDDLKNRLHMAIYSLETWYFDDALCCLCVSAEHEAACY